MNERGGKAEAMSRPSAEDHDDPYGGIGREGNDPSLPWRNGLDEQATKGGGVTTEAFYAYMPLHSYIFIPSREMWPAASVNAKIPPLIGENGKPIPASAWLDKNRSVEQMTWAPGKPMLINGKLIADGGWIDRDGVSCFNFYRPAVEGPGDSKLAGRWIDHVNRMYQNDASHIINWLAQRVQQPDEKINHALVLGGKQALARTRCWSP